MVGTYSGIGTLEMLFAVESWGVTLKFAFNLLCNGENCNSNSHSFKSEKMPTIFLLQGI